jgi:hypothetical protein
VEITNPKVIQRRCDPLPRRRKPWRAEGVERAQHEAALLEEQAAALKAACASRKAALVTEPPAGPPQDHLCDPGTAAPFVPWFVERDETVRADPSLPRLMKLDDDVRAALECADEARAALHAKKLDLARAEAAEKNGREDPTVPGEVYAAALDAYWAARSACAAAEEPYHAACESLAVAMQERREAWRARRNRQEEDLRSAERDSRWAESRLDSAREKLREERVQLAEWQKRNTPSARLLRAAGWCAGLMVALPLLARAFWWLGKMFHRGGLLIGLAIFAVLYLGGKLDSIARAQRAPTR